MGILLKTMVPKPRLVQATMPKLSAKLVKLATTRVDLEQLDTLVSPRPLMVSAAPRPAGSNLTAFYGLQHKQLHITDGMSVCANDSVTTWKWQNPKTMH